VFSDKFACPICKLFASELEPRCSPSNSTIGACPVCEGTRAPGFLDPHKDRANPHLRSPRGRARLGTRRNAVLSVDSVPWRGIRDSTTRGALRELPPEDHGLVCSARPASKIEFNVPRARAGHASREALSMHSKASRQEPRAPLQGERIGDVREEAREVPLLAAHVHECPGQRLNGRQKTCVVADAASRGVGAVVGSCERRPCT